MIKIIRIAFGFVKNDDFQKAQHAQVTGFIALLRNVACRTITRRVRYAWRCKNELFR